MAGDQAVIDEQIAYYRARAPEYDAWWRREGCYDRGAEATAAWNADVAALERALDDFQPAGKVLELASGTGWWTERLARYATSLTCVDASAEAIAINRGRLASAGLSSPRYEQADLFAWCPTNRYDTIFFSFWLSHVPPDRFAAFWASVADALAPGGRVFLIDSLAEETSTAIDHAMPDADAIQQRRLDDGRTFRIVKRFYAPDVLTGDLRALGWRAELHSTARYFLYGSAVR
jgi:SAM-dependent methyltransferase